MKRYNLINPYKKFNPHIYEEGRKLILRIIIIGLIILTTSTIIGLNMEKKFYSFPVFPIDDYPTLEEAYPFNFTFTWWIISIFLFCTLFFSKKVIYHLKIKTKFQINKVFGELDKIEVNFINKNFKQLDFKSKIWWINPHKGYWKGEVKDFSEDVKIFTKKTNKKAIFYSDQVDPFNDLQMKKLQTIYSIAIGFIGLLIIDLT
jgi:hypothetical protein